MSADGRRLAVVEGDTVRVLDAQSGVELRAQPRPGVQALSISPLGAFIVTWEKLAEGERGLKKKYLLMLAHRLKTFEVNALKAYSALVPISPEDAKHFQRLGATIPMHTCPVGLPLHAYEYNGSLPEPSSLSFLAALDWAPNREGLDWFLEHVWPTLHAAFPDLRFRIAGRNAPSGYLAELPDGVEFVGEVDDAPGAALIGIVLLAGSIVLAVRMMRSKR